MPRMNGDEASIASSFMIGAGVASMIFVALLFQAAGGPEHAKRGATLVLWLVGLVCLLVGFTKDGISLAGGGHVVSH